MKVKSPTGRTAGQKAYCRSINENQITICRGPAGTGKTYIAAGMASWMLYISKVEKIVLCRPMVACGDELGFLPGIVDEKVGPYLAPLFDELSKFFNGQQIDQMMKVKIIEIVPLALMRGRTFNNSFVILDEAQNATRDELKMFLTRLGKDSKMVICGDGTQTDLGYSDLGRVASCLDYINNIGHIYLTKDDIVRNSLVGEILDAFEADEQAPLATNDYADYNSEETQTQAY